MNANNVVPLVKAEVFDNPIFKWHLRILNWYGFIVSTRQSKWARWHVLRSIMLSWYVVFLSGVMFSRVVKGYESLEDGAITWATAFLATTTGILMGNVHLQRARLTKLVTFVHDDLRSIMANADSIEHSYYKDTVRYLRVITVMLGFAMTFGGLLSLLDSIFRLLFLPDTILNLPEILDGTATATLFFKLFPFPEMLHNFWLGYLLAVTLLAVGVIIISVWHTFITCLMQYATLKQKILNKRVSEMDLSKINADLKGTKRLPEAELNFWRSKMFEFCLSEQLKTRQFIEELQQLIRIQVFIDFLVSSFLICFLLFYFATGSLSNFQYLFTFLYLFAMVLKLLLYHWHTTLLTEENEAMRFAIYCCDWYNYPVKLQKVVYLMILGTTKPLVITAVMVELNLKTFIDVVRCAYSYFNLLRESSN